MTLVRYFYFAAVARNEGAYLRRHVAPWNYAHLEERAARVVGFGDAAFRALGDCDDDHAALACFAEGRH